MDFDKKIEEIGKKFNYSNELVEALKRCVPAMAKGKSKPEIQLLIETLERVEIFDFIEQPNKKQLDAIEESKTNGRNKGVKYITPDKGEYGKNIAPGAYNTLPVFNENMEIIDRIGYMYLTRLDRYSKEQDMYKTTINLSHLIHELGHAWAAQKDEYVQNENGNFICRVGTTSINYEVDKANRAVIEKETKGLFIEEALNTLEEEKVLCEVLEIRNVKEIPGYVPSQYQGLMKSVIESYVEEIGRLPFSKLRILGDTKDLGAYQSILESTEAAQYFKTKQWKDRKRATFDRTSELEKVSDENKLKIKGFLEEYEEVYFSIDDEKTFFDKLDNVLEQLYDFNAIKYSFNIIGSEKNNEIYSKVQTEILREAFAPLNQAKSNISEYKRGKFNISMNELTKQALQTRTKGK